MKQYLDPNHMEWSMGDLITFTNGKFFMFMGLLTFTYSFLYLNIGILFVFYIFVHIFHHE